MPKTKKKLYCYVDETGQDTAGRFFTVSVLITETDRERLLTDLEAIEQDSKKGNTKWKKARPEARKKYIERVTDMTELEGRLFFATYHDSKEYLVHTADVIVKSLRQKEGDQAIVYVDALSEAEQPKLKRQLRPSVKIPTQVRGVRREENNGFIRLVDAICGLVRDADEGKDWAKQMVQKLKRKDILTAL